MISADQPTCLDSSLAVAVSSVAEGSMLDRSYGTTEQPVQVMINRKRLCLAIGIQYERTVYQQIRYAENLSYDKIVDVTEADTTPWREAVHADALYTEEPHVGLFLPVADCIATVFYDPVRRALCVAHLGRHSTVANLAVKVVEHFVEKGSQPEDLVVWLSPHVSKEQYVLDFFEPENESAWKAYAVKREGKVSVDLEGYNIAAMVSAGVAPKNIHVSDTCTFTSHDYFSHSNGDTLERFAVVTSIV